MPNQTYLQQLTSLSRDAFDAASSLNIPAREAVSVLAGIPVRTFSDLMARFAPEGFSKEWLVSALCANDVSRVRASIDKKVRGWLGGKNQPTAREDLLELCFVLRLDPERANAFLLALGGEGIHWRDPKELTAAFALRAGMDYPAWRALLGRVLPGNVHEEPWDADTESFTAVAAEAFPSLTTEKELKAFLEENQGRLGSFHHKARLFFNEYLRVLEQPDGAAWEEDAEESYTTRRIVETYLNRKLPDSAAGNRTDSLRRGVLSGWPDETALSRMKTGKADITRKVLILLFLATDGGEEAPAWSEDDADDWDENWEADPFDDENDADEAFESSLLRINSMLAECGFQMLDPRAPFDWIVIYCMRVGDDPEEMAGLTERLYQMMDALFSPEDA